MRMNWKASSAGAFLSLWVLLCLSSSGAFAEDIGVANFGTATNGMPWAVVLEKGYFKEAGVDITGIISSLGGGTDIRVMLGGNLPFAEVGLSALLSANEAGADLVIVSCTSNSMSEFYWVTMRNSPINSIKDLKGKRLSFSNPGSNSEALAYWLVDLAGLNRKDAQYIAAGSLGAALTALENGAVDVAPIVDPIYPKIGSKYKTIARASELFPPISETIGVASRKTLRERPEVIRGIIVARRKAVEYMRTNPKESAAMIAKHYKTDVATIETVMSNLMKDVQGIPSWGLGNIEYTALDNMVHAISLIGAIKDKPDYRKYVDESYLPADLQSKKR
jgi:NitT/TauT family transport system substrate-binding protein